MTNDDTARDEIVSVTYRELAQETTPERLDREILEMAKTGTDRRGFPPWIRPVAWAASIGLCLAIVLEVTQTPDSVSQEFLPRDNSVLKEAADLATTRDGSSERDDFKATSAGSASATLEKEFEPVCDLTARASAADWYACIESLRELERTDDADAELEQLRRAFPEFKPE